MDPARTCYRCGGALQANCRALCQHCLKPEKKVKHAKAGDALTFRENQVVEMICQSNSNKLIGYNLGLTEGTIKQYLHRIFRKLNVRNRTAVAVRVEQMKEVK